MKSMHDAIYDHGSTVWWIDANCWPHNEKWKNVICIFTGVLLQLSNDFLFLVSYKAGYAILCWNEYLFEDSQHFSKKNLESKWKQFWF